MLSRNFARSAVLLGALAATGSATATDEIVWKRGWPVVARTESEECRAEVRGNGRFYRIAGTGMAPGERLRFHLTNEDIRPLDYTVIADQSGSWSRYYLPFLWNRVGGTVSVDIESASCRLGLSFEWTRQTGGLEFRELDY